MFKRIRDLDLIVHLFFLIAIVSLLSGFLFLYSKTRALSSRLEGSPEQIQNEKAAMINESETCGEDCKQSLRDELKKFVSDAIATIAAVPKTIVENKTEESSEKITYLSLGGTFTTKSTDWVDITSTDVWINLAEEYGEDAYVDWEAFAKTASSGSKAMVRLYDTTNKIGVNGSELETNSATVTRLASGRLYLWRGHNLYRVQIKSLNGVDATFDSGRIKITY